MSSSSKAVVRDIWVTNLIYNIGLSGDHFLFFTWHDTRRTSIFRTDFCKKVQKCQKYNEVYRGNEKYTVADGTCYLRELG